MLVRLVGQNLGLWLTWPGKNSGGWYPNGLALRYPTGVDECSGHSVKGEWSFLSFFISVCITCRFITNICEIIEEEKLTS